ncbi:hypothetical protein MHU86_18937 [Fragilaria crotonensis]|nr:hypothetical protein MHU86_21561 [Fragilaria crotonensis]KAI2495578.1 hypothetical protein MHU86_18937 [Fragilaria crotonensis]
MSSRQQKRKRSDAENKDPQQRKKGNARGGSKIHKKTVSDLDKESNVNKGTHDKADKEAQLLAEAVVEDQSGPSAVRHKNDETSGEDGDDSSVEEEADEELDGSATNSELGGAVIDIRNGTRPPSRDQPLVEIRRGQEAGTAGRHIVVDNGRPPSRDQPLVEIGHGQEAGTAGRCIVVNNGRPPSRDHTIVDGGRRNHLGTGWSVNHGGPPFRGHQTGGNDRVGDQVGGGYSIVTNGQHPSAATATRLFIQARHQEWLDEGPPHGTSSPKSRDTCRTEPPGLQLRRVPGAHTSSGEDCHLSCGEIHYL